MLKWEFTTMTRRKIVDVVVKGIIVGGVLDFVTVGLINNSQNAIQFLYAHEIYLLVEF